MQEIITAFIAALTGTGIGAGVAYLALQKVIDSNVEKRLEPVWKRIDEFKKDYVSKEIFTVTNGFFESSLNELKAMMREMNEKLDRKQ